MLVGCFWVAFVITCYTLFYRASVWALGWLGRVPGIGRLISATSSKGTDTFRFGVGALFAWTVSVNREKGTLTGSIQIDPTRRWGVLGCLAAGLAAFVVPVIAGMLMPAALVAVGVARARRWAPAKTKGEAPRQAQAPVSSVSPPST